MLKNCRGKGLTKYISYHTIIIESTGVARRATKKSAAMLLR